MNVNANNNAESIYQSLGLEGSAEGPSSRVPSTVVAALYAAEAAAAKGTTAPPSVGRISHQRSASRMLSPRPLHPIVIVPIKDASVAQLVLFVTEIASLLPVIASVNTPQGDIKMMVDKLAQSKDIVSAIVDSHFQNKVGDVAKSAHFSTVFDEAYALTLKIDDVVESTDHCLKGLQQQLQKTISYLLKLQKSDEALEKPLAELMDILLKNCDAQRLHLFACNELELCKQDHFYQLPVKPLSEQGRYTYEALLQKMALQCLCDPNGTVLKKDIKSSSGVYEIGLNNRVLFIFKPCEEESTEDESGRFPKGEGAMREYLSSKDYAKCTIARLQWDDKVMEGFLIEYYQEIIGSVFYLHQAVTDEIEELTKNVGALSVYDSNLQLELLKTKQRKAMEIGFDPSVKFAIDLPVWSNSELDRKKMQRMMLQGIWNSDMDLNPGNFLIRAYDLGNEYRVREIINIDRGRALPSRPYEDKMSIWQPGWIKCEAATSEIVEEVKFEFLNRKPLDEVKAIKSGLPSMTDEAAIVLLLTKWYIQVGLEKGYKLQQITQGFIDNKVYEMYVEKVEANKAIAAAENREYMPLTLDVCGDRTYASYAAKFLGYYRNSALKADLSPPRSSTPLSSPFVSPHRK